MASNELAQLLITAATGGGAVALVSGGVKAWLSLRSGARASTRAVINDIAEDRAAAEERAERQTRVAEYWRGIAGNYGYQLRRNGITPDPEHPAPPRQSPAAAERQRRSRRSVESTLSDLTSDD